MIKNITYDKIINLAQFKSKSTFKNKLAGISIILGDLGTGKTLFSTIAGYWLYKKYNVDIYANYHLNFPYHPIKCMDDLEEAQNGILILDEIYTIMDAREWQKSKNKLSTLVIRKSRKRSLSVLCSSQFIELVDLRLRKINNRFIYPKILGIDYLSNGDLFPSRLMVEFHIKDIFGTYNFDSEIPINVTPQMLNLYDSYADVFDFED